MVFFVCGGRNFVVGRMPSVRSKSVPLQSMMNHEPVLSLDRLSTGYPARRRCRVPVAHGLTASLPPATLTALLGVNGAGKSTLLRTVAGFLPPLGGRVLWEGRPLDGFTPRELARKVAVVLTGRIEAGGLSVRQVVESGRMPYTSFDGRLGQTDREAVERAMGLTGADRLAGRTMDRLSDGERQRVMIAKALAQDTPVILLDEPAAFLDFPGRVAVLRLLRRLVSEEGKTVLFSTHDLELTLSVADRLWLLAPDGITEGAPRALADEGVLSRLFESEDVRFDRNALRFVPCGWPQV